MTYWNNKKICITGGAGFIGSALAQDLAKNNSQVTIIDNLSRGNVEFLGDCVQNIDLKIFDLRNYNRCIEEIKGFDIVIHLASRVGGIKVYTDQAFSIMNDNLMIDTNVIKASIKNNIKRFFYASSAHVYPIELQNKQDEIHLIDESDVCPANPLLSYGWAKLIAEKQLESAVAEVEDFSVAIARYIGIYGSNQDFELETGSVIPVFSHRAIKYPDIDFTIWGNGEETRSYCYIDDAVECTKLMIKKMDEQDIVGPYNVGSNDMIKIKDIARKVVALSQKDIPLKFDTTKKAKILSQWCDCKRIFEELGWKSTTSFEKGLEVVYNDVKGRIR